MCSGRHVGKSLSGELKGCHVEGVEAMLCVIQRTQVGARGGCFRTVNLGSIMEKNFPAIRAAPLGSQWSPASSQWVLEDHLLEVPTQGWTGDAPLLLTLRVTDSQKILLTVIP